MIKASLLGSCAAGTLPRQLLSHHPGFGLHPFAFIQASVSVGLIIMFPSFGEEASRQATVYRCPSGFILVLSLHQSQPCSDDHVSGVPRAAFRKWPRICGDGGCSEHR